MGMCISAAQARTKLLSWFWSATYSLQIHAETASAEMSMCSCALYKLCYRKKDWLRVRAAYHVLSETYQRHCFAFCCKQALSGSSKMGCNATSTGGTHWLYLHPPDNRNLPILTIQVRLPWLEVGPIAFCDFYLSEYLAKCPFATYFVI